MFKVSRPTPDSCYLIPYTSYLTPPFNMHTATSGPMMIFFFTVVTVILPALVLAGVVAFAAHDARAARDSKFTVIGSQFTAGQTVSKVRSLPTSTFSVRRTQGAPRRIFSFLSAKFGKCS
jgi:hypothetical protein